MINYLKALKSVVKEIFISKLKIQNIRNKSNSPLSLSLVIKIDDLI